MDFTVGMIVGAVIVLLIVLISRINESDVNA